MNDKQFLHWIADRIVNVYGESESTDFVRKIRAIANELPDSRETDWFQSESVAREEGEWC